MGAIQGGRSQQALSIHPKGIMFKFTELHNPHSCREIHQSNSTDLQDSAVRWSVRWSTHQFLQRALFCDNPLFQLWHSTSWWRSKALSKFVCFDLIATTVWFLGLEDLDSQVAQEVGQQLRTVLEFVAKRVFQPSQTFVTVSALYYFASLFTPSQLFFTLLFFEAHIR